MSLPRLLITISFSFSIRYIIRTGLLDQVKKFAEPVIVLTWNEESLVRELQLQGIEVYVLSPATKGSDYANIRRKIDYWFWHFRLNYPSKNIQDNYLSLYKPVKTRIRNRLIKAINIAKFYTPGFTKYVFKKEARLLATDTNYQTIKSFATSLHANAVFTVTPFHNAEDLFLRACKAEGLQMITSILSFDNLTKRGWISVAYDVYMVWNKHNLEELNTIYPFTKNKKVCITGAPQFDFYTNEKWLLPGEEWLKVTGLNKQGGKKIILYAGGPQSLFPHEPQYLKDIDAAINNGAITGAPVVLFRCHPVDDLHRWKQAIGDSPNIVFDDSWTGKEKLQLANISDDDIKKLCSTLAYTDVHINLCSTMTLDGSAYCKPQIGPAYVENNKKASKRLKKMYYQKHFEPIVKKCGIRLAQSKKELIACINEALENPELFTKHAKEVVKETITFSDGKATERVVRILQAELSN